MIYVRVHSTLTRRPRPFDTLRIGGPAFLLYAAERSGTPACAGMTGIGMHTSDSGE